MMAEKQNIIIRNIEAKDNAAIAHVIRTALTEFKANKPGTVYFDPTTDNLFELFKAPRSAYLIAEQEGKVVGGGGIFPTEGLPGDTCELVKMYLLREVRGIGLGRILIEKCLDLAKEAGFSNVYLETMPELKPALKAYEKLGFEYLEGPVGNSGHFGCSLWMMKRL